MNHSINHSLNQSINQSAAAPAVAFLVSVFAAGGNALCTEGNPQQHYVSLDLLKHFSRQGKSTTNFVLVRCNSRE